MSAVINQSFQTLKLSPHSSLAAVDDGTNAHCFYTSDDNQIQRVRIDGSGTLTGPFPVVRADSLTPKGSIAAALLPTSPEEIFLFYQYQDVSIYAATLTQSADLSFHIVLPWTSSTSAPLSGGGWSSSTPQKLT